MQAITLHNVRKSYPAFTLGEIDLSVPQGCVMGLIGQNGAGKSTLIRLLLGLIHPDSGEILLADKQGPLSREHIGVVFDECCFPETLTPRDIGRILRTGYHTWSRETYAAYLKRFELPETKPVHDFSRGMKMKLSIACALSHDSRLLILDEATSGLDPVVRDEILELFYDFMQDERHTILMSSHITGDLEKICDYITCIHKGQLVFSEEKDRLLGRLGILRCDPNTLTALDPAAVYGVRRTPVSTEALVARDFLPHGLEIDPATLDDIILFVTKEAAALC